MWNHAKSIFLVLVFAAGIAASSESAWAVRTYQTQGEASAACQGGVQWAIDNGAASLSPACTHVPQDYICAYSGTQCNEGGLGGVYRYIDGCSTDVESMYTGNPPPATLCSSGCGYVSGGTGVGVCTSSGCLSPYTGTGGLCDGTEGAGVPDDCTVSESGTVVCDCVANPDAAFCNTGSTDCETVDGITECWAEDDPNNPNFGTTPDYDPPVTGDPVLPTDPVNPADPAGPAAPGDVSGGGGISDGSSDPQTGKDSSDGTNAIVNAVNQATQAVNVNADTVWNAGNQVTEAINLNRSAVTAAVLAAKDALVAQANADRKLQLANDIAIANNTRDAITNSSEAERLVNEAIRAQLIADGLQANADAAALVAAQVQTTDAINADAQQHILDAISASAAAAANTAAINAAASSDAIRAAAMYQAVIDAATQAALDAASATTSQDATTQAITDLAADVVDETLSNEALLLAQEDTTASVDAANTAIVAKLEAETTKVTDELKKQCNPYSDAECPFVSTAQASNDCSLPLPPCSGDPVRCEQLKQTWYLMCNTNDSDLLAQIRDRLPDENIPINAVDYQAILDNVGGIEDDILSPDGAYFSPVAGNQTKLEELKGYFLAEFNMHTNSIFVSAACPNFTIDMTQAGFSYTFPFDATVGKYTRAIMAVFIWVWALYTAYWLFAKWSMKA